MTLRRQLRSQLSVSWIILWAISTAVAADSPHALARRDNCSLHPDFNISLFAQEPDVVDPVALTFDELGRMYVVEMRDYPYGIGPNRETGGTVRLLEDTNSDGRCDRSTLFAEGLSFPTSILPWNGGVLVTAPPEILFLCDTNGDGKADVREVVLKGFTLGVTDSNVNGLRWGLDNRVHGINGGNGGETISPRRPSAVVSIRNADFSFDPTTGDGITTSHTSAGFGLVFDEWGRSFVTYNINHIQQRIIPLRYLTRFAGLPPVAGTESISDHGEMSRIFPISVPETRVNHPEQSGYFSSAGGMGYIGDRRYPDELRGNIFVCDVVGNLVHRDVLHDDGPVYRAARARSEEKSEFFASADPAFRPVALEPGPDGGLYLIDMQRDVIEHPDYIPDKVKKTLDLRAGSDRGRVYRLTLKRGNWPVTRFDLRTTEAVKLVGLLSHPSPWWRATAQRLLVERRDRSVIRNLEKLARRGNALGRLHALWTLQGLGALTEPLLEATLTDDNPGLRENGLLLAEPFLGKSRALQKKTLRLANDSSARVRFQAALTIGQFDHPDRQRILKEILRRDHEHRWTRLAALSSLRDGEGQILHDLLAEKKFRSRVAPSKLELIRELADLAGARAGPDANLETMLGVTRDRSIEEAWRLPVIEGLTAGMGRSGLLPPAHSPLASLLPTASNGDSPALVAAVWKLSRRLGLPESAEQTRILARAERDILENSRPLELRLGEAQLLGLGGADTAAPVLFTLMAATQPPELQSAALDALRNFESTDVATGLLAQWRTLAPAIRPAVINLLLQRVTFHETLIKAVEDGTLTLGELNLDLEQRRRLLRESSPSVKQRAAKLIGDEEYSNRKEVVEEWLRKLPSEGNAAHGRAVAERVCAQCHGSNGRGNQVGPDFATLTHRSVEDLLSNILDPNMAINPGYVSYTMETHDSVIETGILKEETADAVTLLQALGKRLTIPRRDIKRLESSGLSLMPEGLEAGLSPGDLRDLIAYIQAQ